MNATTTTSTRVFRHGFTYKTIPKMRVSSLSDGSLIFSLVCTSQFKFTGDPPANMWVNILRFDLTLFPKSRLPCDVCSHACLDLELSERKNHALLRLPLQLLKPISFDVNGRCSTAGLIPAMLVSGSLVESKVTRP